MEKCALVYNKNSSGCNERIYNIILKEIKNAGFIPVPIDSSHKDFLIENMESLNEEFDYILSMGGDGTVNKAYEGFSRLGKEQKAIYGHIPTGTTNDMGPNTNVPRYKPKTAAKLLLHGQIEERDIVTLNDRAIAYVGAMGVLAPVTYLIDKSNDKKDAGTFSYIRYGASQFFKNPELYKNIVNNPFNITYEVNGKKINTNAIFIAIFNAKSFANLSINPYADMTDGTFDVAIIPNQKEFLKLVSSTFLLEHGCMGIKSGSIFTTDNLKITFEDRIPTYPINCDGDAIDVLNGSNTLEAKTKKKVKQLVGRQYKSVFYK